jgi:hypothetical protein
VIGANESYGDEAIFGGAIFPGVAGAILNDGIAGSEEDFGAVVEHEIDFAGEDNIEIDGVGGVHAGVHGFEDFDHAGEFGLDFSKGSQEIGVFWNFAGAGGNGEEGEAKTAGGREVTGLRGRGAVGGEFGDGIGAPEAVEFEAGEQGESDGFDGGVFHKDGFARGVAAGDDAADVHGVSSIVEEPTDCTFSEWILEAERRQG